MQPEDISPATLFSPATLHQILDLILLGDDEDAKRAVIFLLKISQQPHR